MKILVLTDLHGQRDILAKLTIHLSQQRYDGVFMLGDLCNRHDIKALEYAADFIDLITQKYSLPLYLVHGNNEPDSVKLLYQQKNITVHFNEKRLGDYQIIGIGYGDDFPTDPYFAKDKILLTHEPPRAAAISQMEQKGELLNAPILHFSGHLHGMQTIRQIGRTVFVQVPSAMLGKAAVLQLPSIKVEFIEI